MSLQLFLNARILPVLQLAVNCILSLPSFLKMALDIFNPRLECPSMSPRELRNSIPH